MSLRARYTGVSLGLFAGDLCTLSSEAQEAVGWGCDILHFDVMDGVFAPQMTGGPGFLKLAGNKALKDVHLMIQRPAEHVETYVSAGADAITVHVESDDAVGAISKIRAAATKQQRTVLAGISLMPGTPLDEAQEALDASPDVVLVLAFDPRTTDAPDVPAACARLAEIRRRAPNAILAFDGGVTLDTMPQIVAAGPDLIVSGSAIMRAQNRAHSFTTMLNMMRPDQATMHWEGVLRN